MYTPLPSDGWNQSCSTVYNRQCSANNNSPLTQTGKTWYFEAGLKIQIGAQWMCYNMKCYQFLCLWDIILCILLQAVCPDYHFSMIWAPPSQPSILFADGWSEIKMSDFTEIREKSYIQFLFILILKKMIQLQFQSDYSSECFLL